MKLDFLKEKERFQNYLEDLLSQQEQVCQIDSCFKDTIDIIILDKNITWLCNLCSISIVTGDERALEFPDGETPPDIFSFLVVLPQIIYAIIIIIIETSLDN